MPPRRADGTALLPYPIALAAFVLIFWCVDITSPALPDLQDSLGLSQTSTGLIASTFFVGRLVTNIPVFQRRSSWIGLVPVSARCWARWR